MTARPRLTASTINDDQLDALHARLDAAEALLREFTTLADVTHRYRIQGGHDTLGANLTCAGCDLAARITAHLTASEETA